MRIGLFPGQGVPVRTVLAALSPEHSLVKKASEVLCYDLHKQVEQIAKRERSVMPTSLAQPAIFTASVAAWHERADEQFDFFLGHSVGEYAALVAGGSMSFEQALCVVQVRGAAMQKAALEANGGMVALIDLTLDEVEAIADATGTVVANDNSPAQVVLAGDHDALVDAATQTRERGGRAVRLDVTGPFHTPEVASAATPLRDALEHISIRSPSVPVISNVSTAAYRAPGEIRKLLIEQLTSRVRFREALERLWLSGANEFHDFGPGRIIAGLAARTFDSLHLATAEVG